MPPADTVASPIERGSSRTFLLRGEQILFDCDPAQLFGGETAALALAVRRNRDRVPPDFLFEPDQLERANLRHPSGTSSSGQRDGLRRVPDTFTAPSVAVLSSLLRAPRAVQVNIASGRASFQNPRFHPRRISRHES